MRNFRSFSEMDEYYKGWHKKIDSKSICYTCPESLGRGYIKLIGDMDTAFVSIVDYVEYHPFLLRSYMKEQIISIAEVQSGSAQYYRNKNKMNFIESGIRCSINALPVVLYSRVPDHSHLKSTGLVIREAFLRTLSLTQYELEQMAYFLNDRSIYHNPLLFICKQLNHLPVADHLIPLYLKAKATEVVSLLCSFALDAKGKPKLTKDIMENIKSAKEFLDKNYIHPPKIEKLTSMFYVNKNLLQTGFKNLTGYTVYEYVSYQKMNHAIELLLSTDMSVESIASSVGYKSKMNFYNAFKHAFLVTPHELRKNHKSKLLDPSFSP